MKDRGPKNDTERALALFRNPLVALIAAALWGVGTALLAGRWEVGPVVGGAILLGWLMVN